MTMVTIPGGKGFWDDGLLDALENGWPYAFYDEHWPGSSETPVKGRVLIVMTPEGPLSWHVERMLKKCFVGQERLYERFEQNKRRSSVGIPE